MDGKKSLEPSQIKHKSYWMTHADAKNIALS